MEILTQEQITELMKSRGFVFTSEIQSSKRGVVLGYSITIPELSAPLNANVEVNTQSIDLSFGQLRLCCNLSTGRFDVQHKEFDKFIQTLVTYAATLLQIDPFVVIEKFQAARGFGRPVEEPKAGKTLKERKAEFWQEIVTIGKKREYDKAECKKFYEHWIALNPGAKKMWFEKLRSTKTFDTGGRLKTWMANNENWNTQKKNFVEKAAQEQNEKLQQQGPVIDKTKLF